MKLLPRLGAALVVAVAVWFVIEGWGRGPEATDPSLLGFATADEILAVSVLHRGVEVTVARTSAGWARPNGLLSEEQRTSLDASLAGVVAVESGAVFARFPAADGRLFEFGLYEPETTVRFRSTEREVRLEVGAESPLGTPYGAVRVAGVSGVDVQLLPAGVRDWFVAQWTDWVGVAR